MKRWPRWIMRLFGRQNDGAEPPAPPTIDRAALREQMKREDPDFALVSQVHHDVMQPLTAKGIRDGIALRHEREFWERVHQHDD